MRPGWSRQSTVGGTVLVTVTRDDLEAQPAFATVYTASGTTESGDRVRFGGDWRIMNDLFDAVDLLGEMTAQVAHWQVLGTAGGGA